MELESVLHAQQTVVSIALCCKLVVALFIVL